MGYAVTVRASSAAGTIILTVAVLVAVVWYAVARELNCERDCAARGLGHVVVRGHVGQCQCMPRCGNAAPGQGCMP